MVKSLILHGGAGSWRESEVKSLAEQAVHDCTSRAWRRLGEGAGAVEAVVEAVKCMEDSGVLNAGWGSTLNLLGGRSLDAGLMSSEGLLGAVANVKYTKNPILLAKIVAEETPHVLLAGDGADLLAATKGLPPLPPPPKHVVERYYTALKKLLNGEVSTQYYSKILEHLRKNSIYSSISELGALGDTVGAVAVDDRGVLAAATSTGGVILKLPGRVGDTPLPGAGFYASKRVACSSTGIGEMIIRTMPCLKLDLEYDKHLSVYELAKAVVDYVSSTVGPDALGFIAVDAAGNGFYGYNTEAMLVGYVNSKGEVVVKTSAPGKVGVVE
mgnify:CR=1 FL=1